VAEAFRAAAKSVAAKLSVLADQPAPAPGLEWKS
jgi:hypothetical protein